MILAPKNCTAMMNSIHKRISDFPSYLLTHVKAFDDTSDVSSTSTKGDAEQHDLLEGCLRILSWMVRNRQTGKGSVDTLDRRSILELVFPCAVRLATAQQHIWTLADLLAC